MAVPRGDSGQGARRRGRPTRGGRGETASRDGGQLSDWKLCDPRPALPQKPKPFRGHAPRARPSAPAHVPTRPPEARPTPPAGDAPARQEAPGALAATSARPSRGRRRRHGAGPPAGAASDPAVARRARSQSAAGAGPGRPLNPDGNFLLPASARCDAVCLSALRHKGTAIL